jgi:uncharacterized SAM-binding protein YcdF (DUF218 family)
LSLITLTLVLVALWFGYTAWQIVRFGSHADDRKADAAVVLGAAAWGKQPSPVYRERINEAIELFRRQQVRHIIFTGGTPAPGYPAEGEVGRAYALAHGVPAAAILVDAESRTTWQNLIHARQLMADAGIRTALLVSDPLHLRRASAMADDLGIPSSPAPTSSSRFQSWRSRAKFLWRETWLYLDYLIWRHPS